MHLLVQLHTDLISKFLQIISQAIWRTHEQIDQNRHADGYGIRGAYRFQLTDIRFEKVKCVPV